MERPDYKGIRESKGIALKSIFEETRISIFNLEAIEKGDYAVLPAPFISRAFIKSYAQAIGIDPQGLLDEHEEFLQRTTVAVSAKEENIRKSLFVVLLQKLFLIIKQKKNSLFHAGVAFASVFVLLILMLLVPKFLSQFSVSTNAPAKSTNDTATERVLLIKASEKVSVRIKKDDSPAAEFILLPGGSLEQKARDFFVVEISDASAVLVFFQGKEVKHLGRTGEKARLVLPPIAPEGSTTAPSAQEVAAPITTENKNSAVASPSVLTRQPKVGLEAEQVQAIPPPPGGAPKAAMENSSQQPLAPVKR